MSVCPMDELTSQMNSASSYSIRVSDTELAEKILQESGKANKPETNDDVITAEINKEDIASIVRLLVTGGVDISEVRKNESSLEEIFLQVTGGGIDIE